MTEQEWAQMFLRLDQVWGHLAEDLEGGYRYALEDYPADVLAQVVHEFARGEHRRPEDNRWLPRPPEIAARANQLMRERENDRWLDGIRRRLLSRGEA